QKARRPEGQKARGPEGQKARRPEGQRARGPEGQRARGPEGQRARGPEGQRANWSWHSGLWSSLSSRLTAIVLASAERQIDASGLSTVHTRGPESGFWPYLNRSEPTPPATVLLADQEHFCPPSASARSAHLRSFLFRGGHYLTANLQQGVR